MDKQKKKLIIIIAAAVLALAVVVGVIISVNHKKSKDKGGPSYTESQISEILEWWDNSASVTQDGETPITQKNS